MVMTVLAMGVAVFRSVLLHLVQIHPHSIKSYCTVGWCVNGHGFSLLICLSSTHDFLLQGLSHRVRPFDYTCML